MKLTEEERAKLPRLQPLEPGDESVERYSEGTGQPMVKAGDLGEGGTIELHNPDFEEDMKAEEANAEAAVAPAAAESEEAKAAVLGNVRAIVEAMKTNTEGRQAGDRVILASVALGELISELTQNDPLVAVSVLAIANTSASNVVLAKMLALREQAEIRLKAEVAMQEARAREQRQRAENTGEGGVAVILPAVSTESFKDADPYPGVGEALANTGPVAPQELRGDKPVTEVVAE